MPVTGPLSHIDLTVGDPARAIPFYAALFEALGWRRMRVELPEFQGEQPHRACWFTRGPDGVHFGIEVRPGRGENARRPVDRYAPGMHHMAFHAESQERVDAVHAAVVAAGGDVLDPPADYSGHPSYGPGYYAAFFADPDGIKLELVHFPWGYWRRVQVNGFDDRPRYGEK
jgi:glyoxylase I family protein